uniref:Reverse transcriptase Ty1/copia-type domain-containing protein n=1 Tax=Physcomitrium patens TaxID=3218 RepID=A0A2K1IBL7_PHYPA|nr:hypothetical protein PHYPA_030153 [Physcomitrium patens]
MLVNVKKVYHILNFEVDICYSILGYIFFLSCRTISWHLIWQWSTVFSNIEVEYMTMTTATSKVIWLCYFLYDLMQDEILRTLTSIYCNNQSTLTLVDTKKFYSYTK